MALADDIRLLRDRVSAELTAAHDYYADTKVAWKILDTFVKAGHGFRNRNAITGTETTETELAAKAWAM